MARTEMPVDGAPRAVISRTTDRGDHLLVEETPEPTDEDPTEHWAGRIEWKPGSRPHTRALLERLCREALASNRDYLALAAPTDVEVRAQVSLLTRQASALARLTLDALDGEV